ncbi:MAG: S1C family serine protease [Opitutales bacterium]
MVKFFALLLLCFLSVSAQAVSVVELKNGASLEGDLALERSESIYLDLGFDLLEVPRNAIASMRARDESPERGLSASPEGRLYEVGAVREDRSIRDLVGQLGEAVTLVQTPTGLGSGFIIHTDGYVVTNDHVIAGEHRITVTVFRQDAGGLRRENYENVRIVANSADLDLALLKIEADPAPAFATVPLAAEDGHVREGQKVFALGSPLGLDRTVSEGIISVADRVIDGRLYLQTTTQINPGNSGGPLFNLKGEVVGVTNMKIAAVGAEGLGFSISTRVLKSFLDHLEAYAFDPRNPNSGFRYLTPPKTNQTQLNDTP